MKRAYICDYCGRISNIKDIRKHERECSFNPKNKTCFTCTYCLTDYENNIKCRFKKLISVSFFQQDMITTNCEDHQRGSPTKIINL